MKSRAVTLIVLSLILSVSIGFGYGIPQQEKQEETKQEETKQEEDKQESKQEAETEQESEAVPDKFPQVDNMHHFMEYVVEPVYIQLRDALAEDPGSPEAWRTLKGYALTLAETSSLVADRPPIDATEEQIREWRKISWDVRTASRILYRSMRNYDQAKKNFELMVDNCNKCHDVFEEGRHQLEK